jgi:hypothetical protein
LSNLNFYCPCLSIQSIRAHVFIGNHASDSAAFRNITDFVQNSTNSISHRAEAIRIMGRNGMGLSDAEMGIECMSDAEQVAAFIAAQ